MSLSASTVADVPPPSLPPPCPSPVWAYEPGRALAPSEGPLPVGILGVRRRARRRGVATGVAIAGVAAASASASGDSEPALGARARVGASRRARKMARVMGEYKHGTLHSGSAHGPVVHSRKQAMAIAIAEGRHAARK